MTCSLVLILVAMSRPAAAQQEDVELTARTHYAAGRYQQALELYAELYAKTLHPTYVRNIGRCYQNLGEPEKAIRSFREYLRIAKDLTPAARAEVDGFIEEMEKLERSREAERAASGTVGSAGAPPAAPPPRPQATTGALTLQSAPRPTAPEKSEARPVYARWWFWTALGALVAGGVVTAVVISARSPSDPQTDLGNMPADFKK